MRKTILMLVALLAAVAAGAFAETASAAPPANTASCR